MRVTTNEYDLLHQLARGDADPLPLHAERIPQGYDVHAEWAQRVVSDWRAAHAPDCKCEKTKR